LSLLASGQLPRSVCGECWQARLFEFYPASLYDDFFYFYETYFHGASYDEDTPFYDEVTPFYNVFLYEHHFSHYTFYCGNYVYDINLYKIYSYKAYYNASKVSLAIRLEKQISLGDGHGSLLAQHERDTHVKIG